MTTRAKASTTTSSISKWMWDVTTIQDTRIIGDNQKGVNSRRYPPRPL